MRRLRHRSPTAQRPTTVFDAPSIQQVHNRCTDELFFAWRNTVVHCRNQVIQGGDRACPTRYFHLACRIVPDNSCC